MRGAVLARSKLTGPALRAALTDLYDGWLGALVPRRDGLALVAVGGLGRREPAPYSDLDLVLLHDGSVADLASLADLIWYPIWDSRVGLDHSVRTPQQAVGVAKDDLKALLGLLDARHVAGDEALTRQARDGVRDLWRAGAQRRLAELRELCEARWGAAGEAAYLLEPNLKESRGGLRDAQALHALALSQLVDLPVPVRDAYGVLLDVREAVQRAAGRADDVLRLGDDATLRTVSLAARTVAHALDLAWRRAAPPPRRRLFGGGAAARRGLARDVVVQDGEAMLALDAQPGRDPALGLRLGRAAAENDLPVSQFALDRLAAELAPLPEPWPAEARAEFVALLGAGAAAVAVLEALDLAGLLARWIPEWDAVRCTAQHNPVHRFTVDRHLLETAANAAAAARDVDRPDLLLLGALLHDIGKGRPGDHSEVGAPLAGRIVRRMGYPTADVEMVVALVRHHLLLPDTATRRDLDDPATIRIVVDAVGESAELLDLLHSLTVADARAAGPAAWSDWKARLVADLVRRTHGALGGAPVHAAPPLDERRRRLGEAGTLAVVLEGSELIVAAPDRVGVLYRTAGVLALHGLDVRAASVATHAGTAVNAFTVESRFGRLPDVAVLRAELARFLDGDPTLADRLRAKERSYPAHAAVQPPSVHWFDDESSTGTVVEYRGADRIGLLCRVAAALERCQLDVRSARISSVAGFAVDAFTVTTRDGAPVPVERREDVEVELRRA
jgi:[protein-PII] uridylyltransferase